MKPVSSQNPYLAKLAISGTVGEMNISSGGDVWVATAAGKVYYRSKTDQLWRENNISATDDELSSNHFERISSFSDATMILSGFLQNDGKEDFVFRTEDQGKTWNKVRFGESSWTDGAYFSKSGKAWMTGSSQYIYYTDDCGKTWRTFDKIEKTGNLRLVAVHFKQDGKTGLFGSTWNSLYLTSDNCKTWNKIPTPLDQDKYVRLSEANHPDIRKVRFLGNHYIIRQEGGVFITKSAQIEWQRLNDVVDFEVTEAGNLYTLQKDRSVRLYDPEFSMLWKSEKKMEDHAFSIAVKGERLYALTLNQLYQISPEEFECSALLTNKEAIPTPELKLRVGNDDYGFQGKDVLKYDADKHKWFRYMELNFVVTNAVMLNNKLLISDETYNRFFELNLVGMSLTAAKLPSDLINLKANPVVSLHIEFGSRGCFHQSNAIKSFTRSGNSFQSDKSPTKGPILPKLPSGIPANVVDSLVNFIHTDKKDQITISDLKLSKQDVAQFKASIGKLAKKIRNDASAAELDFDNNYALPGKNSDFNYYKQVADSLFSISPEVLTEVFAQPDTYWSTTTYTQRVIFVFKDGKKLVVENSYHHPNYLLLPWSVEYDGLKLKSNSLSFGQTLYRLTNGGFFGKEVGDKKYAIFRIADYLYRKKIEE
ncbi:hypothetical protein WAE59_12915 [Pedobacter sp. GR22-6]